MYHLCFAISILANMAPIGGNLSDSVQTLLSENPKNVFLETSEVLLRLASNLLRSPDNPKFRRLRLGNAIVQNKLLPVVGGMQCLFEMGFQEVSGQSEIWTSAVT